MVRGRRRREWSHRQTSCARLVVDDDGYMYDQSASGGVPGAVADRPLRDCRLLPPGGAELQASRGRGVRAVSLAGRHHEIWRGNTQNLELSGTICGVARRRYFHLFYIWKVIKQETQN